MNFPRILSAAEQVANHLRDELARGTWTQTIPGGAYLARELGIGRMTADAALEILGKEGLLESRGVGKKRRIVKSVKAQQTGMSIALLLYEPEDVANRYIYELRQQLLNTPHRVSLAPKTMLELRHDPIRVAQMVEEYPADAWIVISASKPVLQWFAEAPVATFALFGRMRGINIAGTRPDMRPAIKQAIDLLIGLGHRRLVMLAREERRNPSPAINEQYFLQELEAHGIQTGPYHMPDWEESAAGLRKCLDSLFQSTPPTAILLGDWMLFLAVQNYLVQNRKNILGKVELISTDSNPAFVWCDPMVPHVHWDHRSTIRRILRWVDHVAMGKEDYKRDFTPTTFKKGNLSEAVPRD